MTAKTDLINDLRNSGIDLAVSTLKRKSMAELETIWSALQDRDAEAQRAVNDGKVEGLNNRETDCGGCENGECDGCGAYACCNEDPAVDAPMPVPAAKEFTVDTAYEFAGLGLTAKELGRQVVPFMGHDGKSVRIKDRDYMATMVESLKEHEKVLTAVLFHRDPAAVRAASRALREHLVRLEDSLG